MHSTFLNLGFSRYILVIPLLFLAIFFIYPLAAIMFRSLGVYSEMGYVPFLSLLGDTYYLGRIWFSAWQALISTVVSVLVALPVSYLFARYNFPGKTMLKALSTLPFVMPTIVVAMGFIALFGANGMINTLLVDMFGLSSPPVRLTNTLTIIIMAHAFYNYAIVVRVVSSLWAVLDTELEDTAKVLGASQVRVLYHVTFPLLLPALISSATLAFAFSFTSMGVVLVLGGPQFATMEVAIYELTTKLFRLPLAAALSVVQLVFTYAVLIIYTTFQEKVSVRLNVQPREVTVHRGLNAAQRVFVGAMFVYVLVLLSPLVALLFRFFSETNGHISSYLVSLFLDEGESYFYLSSPLVIWNSVKFAFFTVLISMVVGVVIAYSLSRSSRSRLGISDALFMMPLGTSAVTLGYGYLISFNSAPFDLRGSWVILVVAHSLIAYPFVIRSVLPVLRGIDRNLRDCARVLGASQTRIFMSIDLPIIAPALLVGATFAFAVSMGEFGSTLMLVRPENTTMPVAIFRFLGLPGASNLGKALAMSSLLMVVVTSGFVVIERFRFKGSGAF